MTDPNLEKVTDPELQKLIVDSIARVKVEEAEAKTKTDAKQAEYQKLLQEGTEKAIAAVEEKDQIPAALLPYVKPTNVPSYWAIESAIDSLREGWLPSEFAIYAPELAPIAFSLKGEWNNEIGAYGPPRVYSLVMYNGVREWETWREAVAKAARMYADQEAFEREEATWGAKTAQEPRALSLEERFTDLLREIVREEIASVHTPDF